MMSALCDCQNLVSIDHTGMLRTGCSGETRLALLVPSSHEPESVSITIVLVKHTAVFHLQCRKICLHRPAERGLGCESTG